MLLDPKQPRALRLTLQHHHLITIVSRQTNLIRVAQFSNQSINI